MSTEILHRAEAAPAATSEREHADAGSILAGQLDELDDDVLTAIADSAAAQHAALASARDRESRALAVICGLIAIEADAALIRRATGVAV